MKELQIILEALVGAIYLDRHYDFTKKWIIQKMIQPYLFMDELEQIDINIKNKQQMTPLHLAVHKDNENFVYYFG